MPDNLLSERSAKGSRLRPRTLHAVAAPEWRGPHCKPGHDRALGLDRAPSPVHSESEQRQVPSPRHSDRLSSHRAQEPLEPTQQPPLQALMRPSCPAHMPSAPSQAATTSAATAKAAPVEWLDISQVPYLCKLWRQGKLYSFKPIVPLPPVTRRAKAKRATATPAAATPAAASPGPPLDISQVPCQKWGQGKLYLAPSR